MLRYRTNAANTKYSLFGSKSYHQQKSTLSEVLLLYLRMVSKQCKRTYLILKRY